MGLLDWLKPRKLAAPRRAMAADPSAKFVRDLIALRMPMSLATLKAASDAASGKAAVKQPNTAIDPLPPIARCSLTGIGITAVF